MKKLFLNAVALTLFSFSSLSAAGAVPTYIRLSYGPTALNDKIKDYDLKYGKGHAWTGALGQYSQPWLRMELEGVYLKHEINDVIIDDGVSTGFHGTIKDYAYLSSFIAELPCSFIRPYVGVGVGYGYETVKLRADTMDKKITDKEKRMVYKGIAGFSLSLTELGFPATFLTIDGHYFIFDKHTRAWIGTGGIGVFY